MTPRALTLAAALVAAACSGACSGAGDHPNVLLVSIDSLRADHLASYGYERVTSPNLDRLAEGGVLFETVVAESSWTLPTHATMFTGLTSRVHGVDRDARRLAPEAETLGTSFRDAGYLTRGIYSAPYLHPTFGFGGGFDEGDWIGVTGESPLDRLEQDSDKKERRESLKRAHGRSHQSVTSPQVTEEALRFLRGVGDEPFFLFLHYFDVHFDYIPPESYWRRFDADYDGDLPAERFLDNPRIRPDMPREDLAHLLARYDGEILWVDEHIGRVLDALEASGLEEETLVVVTADHGDEFFEHGRTGHRRTLYDEVLLVPLVARHPGRTASGRRVSQVVRHLDLMPTLLDWAGVPMPEGLMGTSLAPALRGDDLGSELSALSRLDKPGTKEFITSLRTEEWKLLQREEKGELLQVFYDLELDPREQRARPDDERVAAGIERLQALAAYEEARRAARKSGDQTIEVPEALEAELRALGYLESAD